MKKLSVFLMAAFLLSMVGCSKDAEVNAFITEWDSVTNEMVQKINSGDVDGAAAAFDAKKESLKTKWDGIKNAAGMQVSEDTKKKLTESATKNMSSLSSAMTSNMMKLAADKAKLTKLQALVKEYGDIFKM